MRPWRSDSVAAQPATGGVARLQASVAEAHATRARDEPQLRTGRGARSAIPETRSASVSRPPAPARSRRDTVNPCSMPSGPAAYHSRTGPRGSRHAVAVRRPGTGGTCQRHRLPSPRPHRAAPGPRRSCARDAPAPQLPAGPGPPRVKARVRRAQRPGDRRLRGQRQRRSARTASAAVGAVTPAGAPDTRRRGEVCQRDQRHRPARRRTDERAHGARAHDAHGPHVFPPGVVTGGDRGRQSDTIPSPQGESVHTSTLGGYDRRAGPTTSAGPRSLRRLRLGHRPARSQTGELMTWTAVANLNTARQGLAVVTAPAPSPASGQVLYAIGGDGGANSNADRHGGDV